MTNNERTIIVTGAGGGLGSALVGHLIETGYINVVGQYRSTSERLNNVLSALDLPLDEHSFKADLTDEGQVAAFHDHVKSKFGKVWGVINLAGASTNAMCWKMTAADFTQTLNANLLTTFLTCREFIPELREQGGGRIINTSSVVAFAGTVGAAHYCAAKAAIIGLTKAMALELANKNVTANAMALGYFDRGLIEHLSPELQADVKARTPLKRFGSVEEMGGLVRFLLSDDGAFTTGQVHHINGGYHL